MPKAMYRHYGCRITDDIVYKGLKTVFLENDVIKVGILLDKGADIFQIIHKPSDTDFMWKSPQGIVNPSKFKETINSSSGSFLDNYHGGWQEIFPGGGPAIYRGAELGLHGEVTQLGWEYDILIDTPECIEIKLQVECIRTPFRLERIMRIEKGKPILFMNETVSNLSPETVEFMWGHHPAIGGPFLKEGVKLFIPASTAEVHTPRFAESGLLEPGACFDWPNATTVNNENIDLSTVKGAEAGFAELIYLKGLSDGWYAVLDPNQHLGLGFSWSKEVFKYLWFWLVYGRAPGYPWWDRTYCIALEPWTTIPDSLPRALQMGNAITLQGGEKLSVKFNAIVISGVKEVNGIDLEGKVT